jgi:hypothetical protein
MTLPNSLLVVAFAAILGACGNTAEVGGPPTGPAASPPTTAAPPPPPPAAPAGDAQKPVASLDPKVNDADPATKAFLDRASEYVTFHNNVEKTVPPLDETSDPKKISARETALGEALIKSRPDAKPGDFFIKEYQPLLRQIIKEDFSKRSIEDRKALIQELPKGVRIDVNVTYPTVLPLATFPPNLLKKLPELPKELEYRIVARHLILRDVTGNVIVDVMRDVFPIPA